MDVDTLHGLVHALSAEVVDGSRVIVGGRDAVDTGHSLSVDDEITNLGGCCAVGGDICPCAGQCGGAFRLEQGVVADEVARVVASVVGGIDISLSGAGYYPLFFA